MSSMEVNLEQDRGATQAPDTDLDRTLDHDFDSASTLLCTGSWNATDDVVLDRMLQDTEISNAFIGSRNDPFRPMNIVEYRRLLHDLQLEELGPRQTDDNIAILNRCICLARRIVTQRTWDDLNIETPTAEPWIASLMAKEMGKAEEEVKERKEVGEEEQQNREGQVVG